MNPRKVTYSRRSTHAARAAHARGEREFKTYDTSAIRPKRSRKPFIIAGAVAALVVVVAIVLFSLKGCSSPANENMVADGQEVTVEIVEGSTVPDIAQTLFDVGLVYRTSDFVSAVKTRGAAFSASDRRVSAAGRHERQRSHRRPRLGSFIDSGRHGRHEAR